MRSGKVLVVLLLLAAALGAWLGPAGERVDPETGPTAAFFIKALKAQKAARVALAVRGADPSPAVMGRFRGVEPVSRAQGATVINLQELDWRAEDSVLARGTIGTQPFEANLHLTSGNRWE